MSGHFTVTDVFDVPGRGGILIRGRLSDASIQTGDVLERSGDGRARHIRIIGVEFTTPAQMALGLLTLVVDREAGADLGPGARLELVRGAGG